MKVHYEALLTVDRDNGIKYFQRCFIPGSRTMFTESEYNEFKMISMGIQDVNSNTTL